MARGSGRGGGGGQMATGQIDTCIRIPRKMFTQEIYYKYFRKAKTCSYLARKKYFKIEFPCG